MTSDRLKLLGGILVRLGYCTPFQVNAARNIQLASSQKALLGEILIGMGVLPEHIEEARRRQMERL